MSFKDEARKIFNELKGKINNNSATSNYIFDEDDEYFDEALTSIINLVDRGIIGENEGIPASPNYSVLRSPVVATRDELRAEQRNKLRDGE